MVSIRNCLFAASLLSAVCNAAPLLSLTEAQRIAARDAPQIDAQAAALRAAQHASVGAGELSDPKLIIGIDNLPLDGADRYNITRDFMTMRKIGVMQDFTRGEKLRLRMDRAEAEVAREAAVLTAAKFTLRRDVALAWIERHFAQRQRELVKELMREAELQVATTTATLAGGRGLANDPLTARMAEAQLAERSIEAERNVARATANLGRWIGAAASASLDSAPAFDSLSQPASASNIAQHPSLSMYAPMEAVAASEMKLAEAAKHPDWSLEVAYSQRGPSYSNMLSIGVRIDLPIFQSRRQEPAVHAKLALLERVRAEAADASRMHATEIENMHIDWQAAKSRIQRYASALLPLARERTEIALASYRGGKAELAAVLEARRGEIETRMNHLQAEAELARAWAQLNFLQADTKEPL